MAPVHLPSACSALLFNYGLELATQPLETCLVCACYVSMCMCARVQCVYRNFILVGSFLCVHTAFCILIFV